MNVFWENFVLDLKKRYRSMNFTLNNWTEAERKEILEWDACSYVVVGEEKAPTTGTPHLQGFAQFRRQLSGNQLKKFNNRISWRGPPYSTAERCIIYCKEDGKFEERGTPHSQGRRTDLDEMKEDIMTGKTSVDQITIQNPTMYHQYGRTLEKLQDLYQRKLYRTEMTEGIWLWGPTGVGKSKLAFENFNPDTHYVWNSDNGWWDGYTGQEIVIIDEFRGQIPYNEILSLADRTPYAVRRRGREKIPFISKKVIITSSMPPEEVYKNLSVHDSLDQLRRRYQIIDLTPKIAQKCSKGNTKTFEQSSETEFTDWEETLNECL